MSAPDANPRSGAAADLQDDGCADACGVVAPAPAPANGVPALVAGIDEAGRGPLAGPVVAAAVILDPRRPVEGLDDSKRLTAARRRRIARTIRCDALAWAVAAATVTEVDELNVLEATMTAMVRAVAKLRAAPARILVDGNRVPQFPDRRYIVEAVVRGDQSVPSISAASILAKVCRDRLMLRFDRQFPAYGFARNKGYPTESHLETLSRLGPCRIHRRSFAPVDASLRAAR